MGWGTVLLVPVVAAVAAIYFAGDEFHILPQGDIPGVLDLMTKSLHKERSASTTDDVKMYDQKQKGSTEERTQGMVNAYYNIATDFYEYGWGQSFHFAHTKKDESHDDSIRRHEERLADILGLKEGTKALDVGCGVGGPARAIASYSKSKVVGVTLNQYQVDRGANHTKKAGLDHLVEHKQMDFTKMTFEDNTFDGAYAIEATCHAPKLEDVYGEVFRVLKPGAKFATYEWLYTKKYDKNDKKQQEILKEIEYGNGLPPLRGIDDVMAAAKKVGFKVISENDLAADKKDTRVWYHRLNINTLGRTLTHITCVVTEFLGLAPKGTVDIHAVLIHAADGLVAGGKQEIFTPMHLVVMEKPSN